MDFFPAGHFEHAVAPFPEMRFLPHGVHAALLVVEANVPAAHNVQAEAPLALEYEPAGHSRQPEDPERGLYCPATQGEHALTAGVDEKVPTAQLLQVDCPTLSWYCPTGHVVHPEAPVCEV